VKHSRYFTITLKSFITPLCEQAAEEEKFRANCLILKNQDNSSDIQGSTEMAKQCSK
jgi:hypothetical protein